MRVLIKGILLLLACAAAAFVGLMLPFVYEDRIYPYFAQSIVCDVFRSAERQGILAPGRRPAISAELAARKDLEDGMRHVMKRVQLGCGAVVPVRQP